MGFLNDSSKGESIYLEVKEEGTLVRPVATKPQSIWVHKIQEVQTMGPNNQLQTIRKFAHETCTATGRNGVGCFLCNTPDPLWHMLAADEQTNRGGKRVDFPKSPIHILPVYNHELGQAKIMKGGNQIFEEMDKWYDAQPPQGQDLRRCDWRVSKAGQKKRTKYTTIRMDATAFQITPEILEEAKIAMGKAIADRNPTSADKLMQMVRGEQGNAQLAEGAAVQSLNAGYQAPAPQQFALPAVSVGAPVEFSQTAPSFPTPTLPQVAVATVAPTPTASSASSDSASRSLVDEFSSWVSMQPEFQGMGAIQTLIPAIKAQVGHVEYHKLTTEQLASLKTALDSQLAALRTKS